MKVQIGVQKFKSSSNRVQTGVHKFIMKVEMGVHKFKFEAQIGVQTEFNRSKLKIQSDLNRIRILASRIGRSSPGEHPSSSLGEYPSLSQLIPGELSQHPGRTSQIIPGEFSQHPGRTSQLIPGEHSCCRPSFIRGELLVFVSFRFLYLLFSDGGFL